MNRIILALLLGVLTQFIVEGHRGWSRHQHHSDRGPPPTPVVWWEDKHRDWASNERWSQWGDHDWKWRGNWRQNGGGRRNHWNNDSSKSREKHRERWFNMNSDVDCNLGTINIKENDNVVVMVKRRLVTSYVGSCELYFQAPSSYIIKFKFDKDALNYLHSGDSLLLRRDTSLASPWLTYNEGMTLPSKYRDSNSNILLVELVADDGYTPSFSTFKLNIKAERNYAIPSTIANRDLTSPTNPSTQTQTIPPVKIPTPRNQPTGDLHRNVDLLLTECRDNHHSDSSRTYIKFVILPVIIITAIVMLCLVICFIQFRTKLRAQRARQAILVSRNLVVPGSKKPAKFQPPPSYDHYLTTMIALSPQYDEENPPPYHAATKQAAATIPPDTISTPTTVEPSDVTVNVSTDKIATIDVPNTPEQD